MKRLKLMVIFLLMLSLTGCMQKYKATEEQTNAIAEYTAGIVLGYDKNYNQELTPIDELGGEETVTQTPSSADTSDNTQTGSSDISGIPDTADITDNEAGAPDHTYSLTELIGASNFQIDYKSYKLFDTYPDDSDNSYFVLAPRDGYQLLVVSFTIKNISDSKQTLNLIGETIRYQLYVNSDKNYAMPLLSLLENNLQYIDIDLEKGKTQEGVLIFEISKDTELTNINLTALKDSKSTTIIIK